MKSGYQTIREVFTLKPRKLSYMLAYAPVVAKSVSAVIAGRISTPVVCHGNAITLTGYNETTLPAGKQLQVQYFIEVA